MPQVFELNVNRAQQALSTNININGQQLDVKWEETDVKRVFYATVVSPTTQVLNIQDNLGVSHLVDISISGYIATNWNHKSHPEPVDTQHISLNVLSVDQAVVKHLELDIISRPTAFEKRLVKLYSKLDMHPGGEEYRQYVHPYATITKTQLDANPLRQFHHEDIHDGLDIEAEIESLLLLEAEAGDLDAKVKAKKTAIAQSLREHRDQATLAQLLKECDGIVCTAKVIAQRICDKAGIATESSFSYVQVQDPSKQSLIQFDNKAESSTTATQNRSPSNETVLGDRYFALHTSGAAVRQSIELVYPQSVLYKVLGCVAAAFGLTTLFAFIRRKCMSARRRVDQLAEQEERRTARAYRRAARRAELRKRWDAFVAVLNCFKYSTEPERIENYEEKRALILQDAFMEQDIEAAEKGEVMEAEIRELRHAHEIVSSLIRVDESRYDLMAPLPSSNALPPLALLPPGRSRTSTLPSYTSESLPDYRSRISALSTDVESSNSSIDGSTEYSPSNATTSEDCIFTAAGTGSTPRSSSPEGSTSTRGSRFTEISSVINLSPRASEETLRTFPRSSMAWSRRSRDTNDL